MLLISHSRRVELFRMNSQGPNSKRLTLSRRSSLLGIIGTSFMKELSSLFPIVSEIKSILISITSLNYLGTLMADTKTVNFKYEI